MEPTNEEVVAVEVEETAPEVIEETGMPADEDTLTA